MINRIKKYIPLLFILAMASTVILTGCSQNRDAADNSSSGTNASFTDDAGDNITNDSNEQSQEQTVTELEVRFGEDGEPFVLHLYDNETAVAIARHVGTADWNLPIYHYDDYDNWEVMQYYDIPSRYEIPSNPETITSEQAGTVYYSEPNRIILFFQDAEVSGEYTPVGYFDYSEDFLTAVQENPVVEGWGNKIVCISAGE